MSFNPTIDIGDVFKVLVYLGAGLWFISRMQGRVDLLAKEIKSLQDVVRVQSTQLADFAKALIDLARQEERINAIDRRVEDLRRGQGFIQGVVDGEYPRKKSS
jgi:EAL domain-containing protein (putative c-di-GMP-specific phosphodiesterase class I)